MRRKGKFLTFYRGVQTIKSFRKFGDLRTTPLVLVDLGRITSHKTIHTSLNKVLMCKVNDPGNPTILLFTPTCVAAVVINGIPRALQINIRGSCLL